MKDEDFRQYSEKSLKCHVLSAMLCQGQGGNIIPSEICLFHRPRFSFSDFSGGPKMAMAAHEQNRPRMKPIKKTIITTEIHVF